MLGNRKTPVGFAAAGQAAGGVRAVTLLGPEGEFNSSSIGDFHKRLISYICEILEATSVFSKAV